MTPSQHHADGPGTDPLEDRPGPDKAALCPIIDSTVHRKAVADPKPFFSFSFSLPIIATIISVISSFVFIFTTIGRDQERLDSVEKRIGAHELLPAHGAVGAVLTRLDTIDKRLDASHELEKEIREIAKELAMLIGSVNELRNEFRDERALRSKERAAPK